MFDDDWLDAGGTVSDDDRAVFTRVRDWARERVAPVAGELWEAAHFDRALVDELAELGVVGGTIAGHGGGGLSL